MTKKLSKEIIQEICELRELRLGYKMIAKRLNIPRDTVRRVSIKNNLGGIKGVRRPKDTNKKMSTKKTKEKVCTICNKLHNSNMHKFCSAECKQIRKQQYATTCSEKKKKTLISKTCSFCGNEFETNYSQKMYCTKECRERKRLKSNKYKNIVKQCIVCNKEFSTSYDAQKSCSIKCSHIHRYKNPNMFQKELDQIYNGKIVIISEYNGKCNPAKFRCNDCQTEWSEKEAEAMTGRNNTFKGCPNCKPRTVSKGEERIAHFLLDMGIDFEEEYSLRDLKPNGRPLRIDFALFDKKNNIVSFIEYDGEQHFCKENKNSKYYYESTSVNDELKNKYCNEKGIPLIRIPYYYFDDIENILSVLLIKSNNVIVNEKWNHERYRRNII